MAAEVDREELVKDFEGGDGAMVVYVEIKVPNESERR